MQNWDDFRYFLSVARSGSLSLAAESLSVNASTVGRRIDHLEQSMACTLFERQRYGMSLTPQGRRLLDHVQQMEFSVQALEENIAGGDDVLKGRVRLSLTDELASFWLIPNLAPFQKFYPQISLDVMSESYKVDLAGGEADIAIRLREPKEPGLLVRKMGVIKFHVFA